MSEGGKTAIEANDEVVSVAEVKALKKRIRQLEHEPLIKRVITFVEDLGAQITFIIRKKDNDDFFLKDTLKILCPEAQVIMTEDLTKGAACSALYAIDIINNDQELIILNGDQLITGSLSAAVENFRSRSLDGGILVFNAVHPRWSYVLLNDAGDVVQTSEKRPISNIATAGCYYFKAGADFVQACFSIIRKDVNVKGNYFVSSTYNELILEDKKIGVYEINKKDYLSFATYHLYESYLKEKEK